VATLDPRGGGLDPKVVDYVSRSLSTLVCASDSALLVQIGDHPPIGSVAAAGVERPRADERTTRLRIFLRVAGMAVSLALMVAVVAMVVRYGPLGGTRESNRWLFGLLIVAASLPVAFVNGLLAWVGARDATRRVRNYGADIVQHHEVLRQLVNKAERAGPLEPELSIEQVSALASALLPAWGDEPRDSAARGATAAAVYVLRRAMSSFDAIG
jgi:hypothetical protein